MGSRKTLNRKMNEERTEECEAERQKEEKKNHKTGVGGKWRMITSVIDWSGKKMMLNLVKFDFDLPSLNVGLWVKLCVFV